MKIWITFAGSPSAEDLQDLTAIQKRGAVVNFEKYKVFTPSQFARDFGMHPGSITRLLKRPDCPKFEGKIGPTGRVINFLNSAEIYSYLLDHKR